MNTESTQPGDVLDAVPSTAVTTQARRGALAKAPQSLQTQTPGALLALAMQQGDKDLDRMERLMNMQIAWEKREAEKAFVAAMAAFRAEAIVIIKAKEVDFTSAKGRTNYKHADLARIVEAVSPALARHGLSHRWDPRQEGAAIIVRTIVTHAAGHSEAVELSGSRDESGNKNSLQGVGSTISYLSRYGLMAILGLASREADDDGRTGGGDDADSAGADPRITAWTDDSRAASLEGNEPLKVWFARMHDRANELGDGVLFDGWWKDNRTSLRAAANKADAEHA